MQVNVLVNKRVSAEKLHEDAEAAFGDIFEGVAVTSMESKDTEVALNFKRPLLPEEEERARQFVQNYVVENEEQAERRRMKHVNMVIDLLEAEGVGPELREVIRVLLVSTGTAREIIKAGNARKSAG